MKTKKTKLVCTIGPASESTAILKKMVRNGMNVARLNFSHGDYESFKRMINNIRQVSADLNTPIAIMQDLQGPKIRVGVVPDQGILAKKNQQIVLTTRNIKSNGAKIPVQYARLHQDVKKGDKILINDGLIEVEVLKVLDHDIYCRVINGGIIKSRKGINVPTASISAEPITDKDLDDLKFGLKMDVDYVALSFVKNAGNIARLRNLIRSGGGRAKIIAKIERHEAVKNMEEIIHEADGVMVARGDLGAEIPPEQVPLVQKKLIHLANLHGKPVITATEMLQNMIENPRPTRAEISDIANAVFDHSDAIMLSNESAVGKYPVEAVQIMSRVAASTEHEMQKHQHFLPNRLFKEKLPVSYATCAAAAQMAKDIDAKMIVAITLSGFTAQHIAKHRIYTEMIAVTEDPKVEKQLQLVWGMHTVIVVKNIADHPIKLIKQILADKKLAKSGDKIVIVMNATKNEKNISTIVI